MEVTKLTLSEEMIKAINDPHISKKRKKQLRIDRVIEYINSKPAGDYIKKSKLIEVAGFRQTQLPTGYSFIESLVKKGVINCYKDGKHKMSWSIPGEALKVGEIKLEEPEDKPKETAVDEPKKDICVNQLVEKTLNSFELLYSARTFAWEENSDSLREFVKWMKQNERI